MHKGVGGSLNSSLGCRLHYSPPDEVLLRDVGVYLFELFVAEDEDGNPHGLEPGVVKGYCAPLEAQSYAREPQ